ncbi:MAG: hypothetical protein LIP23_08390, partial [Planctomycetes bacterium]|nr:hypothetical protein [Planctomycetota bacterium]
MGRIALTLAWTAALMAAALPAWAEESAPRRNQPEQGNSYSLATIMDKPDLFLDQEVLFYCRFATISDLYKPVNTAFSPVRHVNFAVWPDKAAVWDAGERRTILPTFYIAKEDSALLGTLAGVRKYDLIAVAGLVQSTYGGHPWILVKGLERMDNPEQLLTATVVELMENGCAALAAKNGVYAADCFEQALEQGLPAAFRATGHEKLARAYLLQEKFAAAKDNLRLAVEAEPADPYLHLALAELSVQVNEPDQALAHCRLALAGVAAQPRAYGIQAEAYSQQGKHAAALEALETAANAPGLDERDQAMLIVRRARILAHADRLAEAADAYAQAAAPGSPYANASWLYDEIGLFHHTAYFAGNDTAELHAAPRAYETAAQTADATADHLYRFAEISFQLEQLGLNDDDAASAETIVKQALVEQP